MTVGMTVGRGVGRAVGRAVSCQAMKSDRGADPPARDPLARDLPARRRAGRDRANRGSPGALPALPARDLRTIGVVRAPPGRVPDSASMPRQARSGRSGHIRRSRAGHRGPNGPDRPMGIRGGRANIPRPALAHRAAVDPTRRARDTARRRRAKNSGRRRRARDTSRRRRARDTSRHGGRRDPVGRRLHGLRDEVRRPEPADTDRQSPGWTRPGLQSSRRGGGT
jgi:hypothetical protein